MKVDDGARDSAYFLKKCSILNSEACSPLLNYALEQAALSGWVIMRTPLDDVIYSRDRAEAARGAAESLTTPDAQPLMLDIADCYEKRMQQGIDRLIAARVKVG